MADRLRILCVEDSPADAELAQETLASAGFAVEMTRVDTPEALQRAVEHGEFDLVLSDFSMPGFGGAAALSEARRLRPELPFIFVSGTLGEDLAVEMLHRGATDYVLKQRLARLVPAVQRALQEAKERRIRSEAEQALRANQQFLQHIFEATPNVLAVFDLGEHSLVYLVGALKRTLGYTREELVAMGDSVQQRLLDADDLSRFAEGLAPYLAAKDGEVVERVLRLRHADGTWRWIDLHATVFTRRDDGRPRQILVIGVDVTQRRLAEQRNREQAALLEKARDAIVVLDLEHRVCFWNQGAEALFGWTALEALGTPVTALYHAHRAERFRELQHALLEEGEWSGELDLRKKDGRSVDVEVSWTLLRDERGDPRSVLIIHTDVTERKRLQEQFLQAQKMETVGRLAGGIAHDFNNLLGVMLGYGSMVLSRLEMQNPLRPKVMEMVRAGERAALLTRQLLTFSRKQVVQPSVLDINGVIGEAGKMIRRLIGEQIDVRIGLADNLGMVRADPGQIEQVLMNLAVNARDALLAGGRITIETANAELDEQYASEHSEVRPGRYVMLAVTDTGVGMDAEIQRHIFEPFFTTKGPDKGTGLGLATVYGIVKQCEGHIWVYSELGHGTAFKVYLPRVDAAATKTEEAGPEAPLERGSATILLVEDENSLRELANEVLTESGYEVLAAPNGGAALEAAERHTGAIDLLVTDIVMPGLSGREVWERLTKVRPQVRAIFMSGYPDDATMHNEMLPSGVAFLQKPFTSGALERKVRDVLRGQA